MAWRDRGDTQEPIRGYSLHWHLSGGYRVLWWHLEIMSNDRIQIYKQVSQGFEKRAHLDLSLPALNDIMTSSVGCTMQWWIVFIASHCLMQWGCWFVMMARYYCCVRCDGHQLLQCTDHHNFNVTEPNPEIWLASCRVTPRPELVTLTN